MISPEQFQYHVFLCHNTKEKEQVEKIREQLGQYKIYGWLDKYDFEPFRPWKEQLYEIIPRIEVVAVFLGSSGVGPWAEVEMESFFNEFVKRRIRMGLVILPGCPDELIDTVPLFIKDFHRVDFRHSNPDPMEQLIWGITGVKPNCESSRDTASQTQSRQGGILSSKVVRRSVLLGSTAVGILLIAFGFVDESSYLLGGVVVLVGSMSVYFGSAAQVQSVRCWSWFYWSGVGLMSLVFFDGVGREGSEGGCAIMLVGALINLTSIYYGRWLDP